MNSPAIFSAILQIAQTVSIIVAAFLAVFFLVLVGLVAIEWVSEQRTDALRTGHGRSA